MATIVARRVEPHPHPGSGRFGHCAFCLFGSRRYVKSDVIVYSTFAHDKRPAIRGVCANHAELLNAVDLAKATESSRQHRTSQQV